MAGSQYQQYGAAKNHIPSVRRENERQMGIIQRRAPVNFAWSGDVRKRFTDFLVNEVKKDGTVLRLLDFEETVQAAPESPTRGSNAEPNDGAPKPPFQTADSKPASVSSNDAPQDSSSNPPEETRAPDPNPHTQARETSQLERSRSEDDKPGDMINAVPDAKVPAKHLTNKDADVKAIPESDEMLLTELLGKEATGLLISLDAKVQSRGRLPQDKNKVVLPKAMQDRAKRTIVHQQIRRIFNSRLETASDKVGLITASGGANSRRFNGNGNGSSSYGQYSHGQRRPQNSRDLPFSQLGGEFLHFTLYKENKDTMEAINTVARMLKIKSVNFGFAGTKDRRAATVQRISVKYQRARNLVWLNSRLQGIRVGDFRHHKYPIQLGQHGGNAFVITVKNCEPIGSGAHGSVNQRLQTIQSSVELALSCLKTHGYINYFGLQRFGTHSIKTHLVGMKILQSDFEGAINDILHIDEPVIEAVLAAKPQQPSNNAFGNNPPTGTDGGLGRDEELRARAILSWRTSKSSRSALNILPKRFSSEQAIIKHLGSSPTDFVNALKSITRGMRMLYVHAYQSFVWNHVASERWARHGASVVEGDLVLVDMEQMAAERMDEDGPDANIDEEEFYADARALSAEEAASGQYTIFDIVLPQPGFDVIYPQNNIGKFYVEFMAKPENGGLDPYNMRRNIKEFSLSGGYRHLMGRFLDEPEYAITRYRDDTEQMHPTDLDLCLQAKQSKKKDATFPPPPKSALVARPQQFSDNTVDDDAVMTEQRRRKASEEPPSNGVLRVSETYVQTTSDSSKRVMVGKHSFVTELGLVMQDANSDKQVLGDKTAGVKADAQPEGQQGSTKTNASQPGNPWSGQLNDGARLKLENAAEAKNLWDISKASVIAPSLPGIRNLTFRKASDNPITPLAPANGTDLEDENADPLANRIAVTLKFKLKCSNYATVVMRELMGSDVVDPHA